LLGTLHHPHIAAIHGIEQAAGQRYLILERVEGRTLADRLREGPLRPDDAFDACAQIATALGAAHAHGIVHRDLKPGNVMRTPSGLVKVLDFGLAMHVSQRAAETAGRAVVDGGVGGSEAAASGGHVKSSTSGGNAGLGGSEPSRGRGRLGTPGYMSPEQILGTTQDARTDLFALGAVLYHCLTGERAFLGSSVYGLIAATLNTPVDMSRLPAETPEPVRALLARMLEKDPSGRLADAGEAAAVLAAAARRAPPAVRTRAHEPGAARLPEPATPIVGRQREIAEALMLLERVPLVTLIGPGGCGKTRLAIEIARAAHGSSAGEVWLADLAPAADATALAAAVAAAAELRDPSESGLEAALHTRLGERTGLLVLDNCDRLLGPCAALAARLVARRGRLRILATSREWLGVPGEQTLRVPPLSVPEAEAPATREAVGAAEAVRMFVTCAQAARPGFRLLDSNAGLVATICRDLDGLPLAIELTAALLRRHDLVGIAHDLRRRKEAGPDAVDQGMQPDALLPAIQLGYDRLADDERRFLRALSVFTGGWNLAAADAVCGGGSDAFATLDLLTRLIDKSLVAIQRADRIEPRYRLLDSIRRFAAIRCEAAHDGEALRRRHLDWFLAVAERSAPSLISGADQAHSLARLEADHENLLAALATCESVPGGAAMALRLAGAVWFFWYIRGHFTRGRQTLARALGLPGAEAPTPARAQALFAAGGLALFQGDFSEGRRLSLAALDLYQSLGDRLGVARSLSHLALCESGEGRHAEARERTERAIDIFREVGDIRRLSMALNNLGALKRQQSDYQGALPDHEEALELLRRASDHDGMIITLVNVGLASARLGRLEKAGRRIDEALALVQDLRAKRAGAAALEVAAEVLAGRGQVEAAARSLGAARALRAAIGLPPDPWWRATQAALAERLRDILGDGAFDRLNAAGGALAFEPAIQEARLHLADGNLAPAAAPEDGAARVGPSSVPGRVP
jgi:non-specific serine/threonine protein kinase